jgi:predicted PurR-regulated permease PerM
MKIVHNIESRLSSYLLTVGLINLGLGILVALGMYLIGMPSPLLWGAMAACLNFIPYLGALVGEIIVAMVALLSFDTVGQAFLAPLIYLAVAFVEGSFLTPMILGRKFTIKPVLIILFMIFFGWVWGFVGLFMAVPLLVLLCIMCETVPSTDIPLVTPL